MKLAEIAEVSPSTVQRFRDRQYGDSPRLSTVMKIAHAVGLEINIDQEKKQATVRHRKVS